jgi:hypothetical protein
MPVLALAAAHAGRHVEAATLIGYRGTTAAASRMRFLWLPNAVGEALAGMIDRADHEAAGAALSRRDALAIVDNLQALASTDA